MCRRIGVGVGGRLLLRTPPLRTVRPRRRLLRLLLRGVRPPGQTIPFGPLWFLGVYLVVVCISPLTVTLHRRFRWWVPGAMVAGAVNCCPFVGDVIATVICV